MKHTDKTKQQGFSLLEILMAVAILAMISTALFMSFVNITNAWQKGMSMTESLNHGDFVLEDLAMGLRSAYFPDSARQSPMYGFWLEDNGSDETATDSISWVKMGDSDSA